MCVRVQSERKDAGNVKYILLVLRRGTDRSPLTPFPFASSQYPYFLLRRTSGSNEAFKTSLQPKIPKHQFYYKRLANRKGCSPQGRNKTARKEGLRTVKTPSNERVFTSLIFLSFVGILICYQIFHVKS